MPEIVDSYPRVFADLTAAIAAARFDSGARWLVSRLCQVDPNDADHVGLSRSAGWLRECVLACREPGEHPETEWTNADVAAALEIARLMAAVRPLLTRDAERNLADAWADFAIGGACVRLRRVPDFVSRYVAPQPN